MKNLIIMLALLIWSLKCYSQDYNTTIGIKFSPTLSTYYNSWNVRIGDSRLSLSDGVEIRQRVYKHLIYLETGVSLTDRGYQTELMATDGNGNFIGTLKGEEIQKYLMVPVSVVFKFGSFYSGLGATVNFYLNRKFYVEGELLSREKQYGQKDVLYGAQLFVGNEFAVGRDFLLGVEAFISPIVGVPKYVNYGLSLSVKYILSR